ncbi:Conserved_hypothetical protein [Hexamita inflata]|uniref:Pep3/Vps18/deep orange domain-containing protein n=1 Tax=Hexamita inflata TaxID=28002 RepID=A0AA86NFF0_9EUKA|nr:Conserved hypothetical protein [Hexamita inflata]
MSAPSTFKITPRPLPGQCYTFVESSNSLVYGIVEREDEFEVHVLNLKNTAFDVSERVADTRCKVQKGFRPIRLQVCESGMYACVACSDPLLKTGQFFMLYLNQKKLQSKLIKTITQPVTSITFQQTYSKLNGQNQVKTTEQIESCSPEFILGFSNGEIHACQFVKKELEQKFIAAARASGVQQFEGTDQNAIRAIYSFNINAQTVINQSQTSEFVYEQLNITSVQQYLDKNFNLQVTFVVCGIVMAIYLQENTSFFNLSLTEETQLQLFEMPNLSPKPEQLPLFQFVQSSFGQFGAQIFWAVQPSLVCHSQLQRVQLNFQRIYESALRSICNQFLGTTITADNQNMQLARNLNELILQGQMSKKFSLDKIQGVSQLTGTSIENKNDFQPLLGVVTFDYHLLLVFARKIAVVSYINNKVLYWFDNIYGEVFRQKLVLEEFRKRFDNQMKIINVKYVYQYQSFDNFGYEQIQQKKFDFPLPCSLNDQFKQILMMNFGNETTNIGLIQTENENEHIWKLYLEQNQFETALKFTRNRQNVNEIKKLYAQELLRTGDEMKAAELLAQTDEDSLIVYNQIAGQKMFWAAAQYIRIKLDMSLKKDTLFKPQEKTKDEVDAMLFEDKETYLTVKKKYNDLMNYRRLLMMMCIEAIVMDICYYQDIIKKFNSFALIDSYRKNLQQHDNLQIIFEELKYEEKFIKSAFTNKLTKFEVEDHLQLSQDELQLLIVDSPEYAPYILPNVLKTSLLNTGMADLFAKYSSNTTSSSSNSPEFSIKFYIQHGKLEKAVELLENMKNEKFMQYATKILIQKPTLVLNQIKKRVRDGMNLNMIIPVLLNLVKQNKNVAEVKEFCNWLVMDIKVLKSYIITFVFQVACEIGQDQVLLYLDSLILDNKLDFLELIQLSRINNFKKLEIECLYRLNKPIDALTKQMKLYSQVDISEIANIDNDLEISLGCDIDETLIKFQQMTQELGQDIKKVMYQQQFKWLINIKVNNVHDDQMRQIRKKILEKIFYTVQMTNYLELSDAIEQIPDDFTLQETKYLTDQLFDFNKDSVRQAEEQLKNTADSLKKYQIEFANQATRVVVIQKEVQNCSYCQLQLNKAGPSNDFDYPLLNQFQIVFQCCHCYHFKCYCELLQNQGGQSVKKTLNRFIAVKDLPNSQKEVEKLIIEIKTKGSKECIKCSEQDIVSCLELL